MPPPTKIEQTPLTQTLSPARMSLTLLFELEKLVGRNEMRRICEQYMYECADGSGNRFWADCSGEPPSSVAQVSSFITPPKEESVLEPLLKSPPRIVRCRSNNILNDLLEPLTPTRLVFKEPQN
jgi:hypothetical protein